MTESRLNGESNDIETNGENKDEIKGDSRRASSPRQETKKICRDFLNNVCFRGSKCRYEHPGEDETKIYDEPEVTFCLDFVNKRHCLRGLECKYVHCNRFDMDEYKRTKRISEGLARAIVACIPNCTSVGKRPLCKQFAYGDCRRGPNCRFWHICPREVRASMVAGNGEDLYFRRSRGGIRSSSPGSDPRRSVDPSDGYGYYAAAGNSGSRGYQNAQYPDDSYADAIYDGLGPRDHKRARYSGGGMYPPPVVIPSSGPGSSYAVEIREENNGLRHKIEVLKRTLNDLQAANTALVGENQRLRNKLLPSEQGRGSTTQGSIRAPFAPGTAVSTTLTPEQQLAVVSLAATALAQQQQQQQQIQSKAVQSDASWRPIR